MQSDVGEAQPVVATVLSEFGPQVERAPSEAQSLLARPQSRFAELSAQLSQVSVTVQLGTAVLHQSAALCVDVQADIA